MKIKKLLLAKASHYSCLSQRSLIRIMTTRRAYLWFIRVLKFIKAVYFFIFIVNSACISQLVENPII